MAARHELALHVQSSKESYVAYRQDVLAPCCKTDKDTTKVDKVSNVLKGIVMCKNSTTVNSIISECQRFKLAKCRRITHHFTRFTSLLNTTVTSSGKEPVTPGPLAPSANITRIVRQELEAIAPATYRPSAQDN